MANTPGQFSSIALAEHALMLILMLLKSYPEAAANCREGTMYQPVGEELGDQVLGSVGLGASGRELAARARCLGMRIHAVDVAEIPEQQLRDLGHPELRRPGRPRRPAANVRHRLAPRASHERNDPPHRRTPPAADEAHVQAGQCRPRAHRGRGRTGSRDPCADDRRAGIERVRPGAPSTRQSASASRQRRDGRLTRPA